MKAFVCEMCSSNNLIKENGIYVCQSCGTKYAVEEAKKLMIEISGTIDISGSTVKIDNSDSIPKYLKLAESAYESKNYKETEEYCNKIIEVEENNSYAWILKGKAAGWQSTLEHNRIEEAANCFLKGLDFSPEEEKQKNAKNISNEIQKLSDEPLKQYFDIYSKTPSKSNSDNVLGIIKPIKNHSIKLLKKCGAPTKDYTRSTATKINNLAMSAWNRVIYPEFHREAHPSKDVWSRFVERGDGAIQIILAAIDFDVDNTDSNIVRYKNCIDIQKALMTSCSQKFIPNYGWKPDYRLTQASRDKRQDDIIGWYVKINRMDPSFEIPSIPSTKIKGEKGCYIATSVYGSYDCPQVWTLRRFRDYTLAETWYGRSFIRIYYSTSPTLVKWFGDTCWFKRLWKKHLDKMVSRLNASGVSNMPYSDYI